MLQDVLPRPCILHQQAHDTTLLRRHKTQPSHLTKSLVWYDLNARGPRHRVFVSTTLVGRARYSYLYTVVLGRHYSHSILPSLWSYHVDYQIVSHANTCILFSPSRFLLLRWERGVLPLTTPYELYQRLPFSLLSSLLTSIVCDCHSKQYSYHPHSWAIVFIDCFNIINVQVSLAFVHIRYTTSVTVIHLMSSSDCLYSLNASVNEAVKMGRNGQGQLLAEYSVRSFVLGTIP
jgi:hypothetical protein